MNAIYAAELDSARRDYEVEGADFSFQLIGHGPIGYFVEPWTNQCLEGPPGPEGQPEPVSLDWPDERITAQEELIREWIYEKAHAVAVADIMRRAPAGWSLLADSYEDDWPEIEFGATVVLFRVG